MNNEQTTDNKPLVVDSQWLLLLLIFILTLIPRIIKLGSFWGTDERYHWELSNNFFLALSKANWAETVPQGLPGLTLAWIDSIALAIKYGWIWLISDGVVMPEQIIAVDRPFFLLGQQQLPVVLVNSLIVVGLFILSRSILGWKAALFGIIFIILDPFLLAESRVLRFEALVAGFMPLSLLAMLLYLKEDKLYHLFLSAILAALAMLTKISALFLLPAIAIIGTATILSHNNKAVKEQAIPAIISVLSHWLVRYLLWVSTAFFFFWLFWPAMWVAPLETLREVADFARKASQEGLGGRGVFFWGQIHPNDPGWLFYPVALLFRITPLVLIGLLTVLVMLPTRYNKKDWLWWGTVMLLVYSLLFIVTMSMGAKKYDRYLMPIFPTLDLVAGVGWLWLSEWIKSLKITQVRPFLIFISTGIILLILQALTTLPHLPYYYTYYNPLLGGTYQAANYIRVGYAEGLDQLAAYMESKPNPASIKLASASSSKLNGLFPGQTIALNNLDGKWSQADYVFIYISQLQRGKHSADILAYLARNEPDYILNLHGLEYGRLYTGAGGQYYGGGYKLEGRGTIFSYNLCSSISKCGQVKFDNRLEAGGQLATVIYWRNEGQRENDRFFIRLMDIDGYNWTEAIAIPRPGFEEANQQRMSIVESEAVLSLPVGMPPGDYFFKLGFRTSEGKIIGYFELPEDTKPIKITTARSYPPAQIFKNKVAYPANIRLNDDLILVGHNLDTQTVSPGSKLWLTVYWQAITDVKHDYVVAIRLLDDKQHELTYWLGRPVRSGYPSTEWKAGQIVQDPWLLTIPSEAKGNYQLEIAVFDADNQAELSRQIINQIVIK